MEFWLIALRKQKLASRIFACVSANISRSEYYFCIKLLENVLNKVNFFMVLSVIFYFSQKSGQIMIKNIIRWSIFIKYWYFYMKNYWNNIPCRLIPAGFFSGSLFRPEDGGDIFLRNVGWLSPHYMALYLKRQNSYIEEMIYCRYWNDSLKQIEKCAHIITILLVYSERNSF
jgi:hypothetical protein